MTFWALPGFPVQNNTWMRGENVTPRPTRA